MTDKELLAAYGAELGLTPLSVTELIESHRILRSDFVARMNPVKELSRQIRKEIEAEYAEGVVTLEALRNMTLHEVSGLLVVNLADI